MTLVLLLALICFEAPRMMKDSLDVCVAQYVADNKISTQALSTDLIYQPEFIEAISLCSATNPRRSYWLPGQVRGRGPCASCRMDGLGCCPVTALQLPAPAKRRNPGSPVFRLAAEAPPTNSCVPAPRAHR